MTTCNFTKVYLNVEIKDFPTGKIHKMHFWINGIILSKDDINNYIENNIIFDDDFNKKYTLNKIVIDKIYYTTSMPNNEIIGSLIQDSIINISVKKETNRKKESSDKSKNKKITLKDINLFEIDTIDLKSYIQTINDELFKREHFLSDQEFDFYKMVKEFIDIKMLKTVYSMYNGDIVKFRKNKIRELLNI